MDTFGRVPVQALARLHMDPEGPTPAVSNTALLDGMPEQAIQAFVDHAGPGTTSTLLIHELRQLGGALGRPDPGAGALPMVNGQFLALGVGIAATPGDGCGRSAGCRRVHRRRWRRSASGRQYLNFVEHPTDPSAGYDPVTWGRLVTLKSAFDPEAVIVANHPVRRTFEIED